MAEALINNLAIGKGQFKGYSAGSHPTGRVHPLALETLAANKLPVEGYRSKRWEEFSGADAPPLDFVFTVCDHAAAEVCPVWPGQPMTAHWGVPDPAAVQGTDEEQRRAFREALLTLRRRIELFASLPFAKLTDLGLQDRLDEIGKH
jgi:protein-tyrosine-phosphatase